MIHPAKVKCLEFIEQVGIDFRKKVFTFLGIMHLDIEI